MKLTYRESDYGFDVELTPETPKEVSELARFTLNAKAEKLNVTMFFSSNEPSCSIWMKKVKKAAQYNSIRPKYFK